MYGFAGSMRHSGWLIPSSTVAPGEQVVAIEVHDLVPRRHEVAHKLLLPVVARVDLSQRAKLGMCPDDEVSSRRGPLGLSRSAIAALVHILVGNRGFPCRTHVEQVHEEV